MNAKWTILGKKFATLCILPLAAVSGCMSLNAPDRVDNSKGAETMQVRIAELEILPEWLDAYLEAAGAVGAESVAKEPGVVCIFPMQKKESPTSIRIVEIYRSEEAYKTHLATPHFRKYKEGTPHMIKSLELVPMRPLDENGMKQIFSKQN
jgi:quinol monooxygenase YgiN